MMHGRKAVLLLLVLARKAPSFDCSSGGSLTETSRSTADGAPLKSDDYGASSARPHTNISSTKPWYRFDGIGGLSGGGATSNFLFSYPEAAQTEILDYLFKPGFAASLAILKVEIGSDDQTTNGCEACHMRSADEVDCNRGYEWKLMKAAVARNPDIVLYGLPWGWAGWLGFGTQNPFSRPAITADYTAKWVECARDFHGLNISVLGLWNEAWQAAGRPPTDPWDYALALRKRLDSSNLSHVRIVAPDGSSTQLDLVVQMMKANASYRAATWGLTQHYPGSNPQISSDTKAAKLPMWSAEDSATYADPHGGGCWARRLVQNAAFGYSATVSYYLLSAFARGIVYDGAGLLRAEWPASGHWEITPTLYFTLHWTRFTRPGWNVFECSRGCALAGGGSYVVLGSDTDVSIIVETMQITNSRCRLGPDPSPKIKPASIQNVTVVLPAGRAPSGKLLDVWKSCIAWSYPSSSDYMVQLAPVPIMAGAVSFEVEPDCSYTVTTVKGVKKPPQPHGRVAALKPFSLPFTDDFERAGGVTDDGGEANYWGDQMGRWETVPAGAGRPGNASRQQLAFAPWPILEPQCNDHGTPLTIIGDIWWEDLQISADLLIESADVGAGVALRVRPGLSIRGSWPGLYLFVSAVPPVTLVDGQVCVPGASQRCNPGGVKPKANKALNDSWMLCADSLCNAVIKQGRLPQGAPGARVSLVGQWHTVALETTGSRCSATIDGKILFQGLSIVPPVAPAPSQHQCVANMNTSSKLGIVGHDYRQTVLPSGSNSSLDIRECTAACCADPRCKAWAVAASKQASCPSKSTCCWLKTGGAFTHANGEVAAGIKGHPRTASPDVPASGFAGLVATLGHSQADNVALDGAKKHGGVAVPPCDAAVAAGAAVSSMPCDYPGAHVGWTIKVGQRLGAEVRLRTTSSHSNLCIGVDNGTSSSSRLVDCGTASALLYDKYTGRISPRTNPQLCLTASQKQQHQRLPPGFSLVPCSNIGLQKMEGTRAAQQFVHETVTGVLRHKGSECIADFPGGQRNGTRFRDCCVALCSLLAH